MTAIDLTVMRKRGTMKRLQATKERYKQPVPRRILAVVTAEEALIIRDTHLAEVSKATASLDTNPEYVRYHYILAVLADCGNNMVQASERIGMHRRTMQRIVSKKAPPVRGAQHG